MRQMTLVTGARIVVRRPRRVNTGGIPLVAVEMTVGRHLHRPVTVVTRHDADAMTAGPRRHLTLANTTIDAPTDRDGRSGYGRNRRESPPPTGRYRRRSDSVSRTPPRSRSPSPPRRDCARDRDRSRDYDRRRDDSRDRYRDRRR